MLSTLVLSIFLAHGGVFSEAQVAKGYTHGQPYDLYVSTLPITDREGSLVMLEREAANAFLDMMEAADQEGHAIKVNYGFRTNEQQTYWYNRYSWLCKNKDEKYCGMAAQPGWSSHQQGVSIDISRVTVFIEREKVERSEEYTEKMDKWVAGKGCREEDKGFVCYTSLYYWLVENASKYGFKNDVPGEPWHWTYQPRPSEVAVGG